MDIPVMEVHAVELTAETKICLCCKQSCKYLFVCRLLSASLLLNDDDDDHTDTSR